MFCFQLTQSGGKLVSCSEVIAASAGWDWGNCDQHPRAVGRFRFLWGVVWGQPCPPAWCVTRLLPFQSKLHRHHDPSRPAWLPSPSCLWEEPREVVLIERQLLEQLLEKEARRPAGVGDSAPGLVDRPSLGRPQEWWGRMWRVC